MLRSFRNQVALGSGLLAITVALILSITLGSIFANKSEEDEATDLRQIASNAARVLAEGLVLRTNSVQALAKSDTLWSDGLRSDRVKQTFARVMMLAPHTAWIGVASADGIVQAASHDDLVGSSVAERPWFMEGRSHLYLGDLHAAKLLAKLVPLAHNGDPQRFIDFATPIIVDGTVIGVIAIHGSWDWGRSVIDSMLPDNAALRKIDVLVLNHDGAVIYGSGRARALVDSRLTAPVRSHMTSAELATDENGEKFLVETANVSPAHLPVDLRWTVVAREPAALALSAAHRAMKISLLLGALASLGACVVGWFVAEHLTRPLRAIAVAAKAVESGIAGARIPRVGGSIEISQLSSALIGMTENLEAQVKERTSKLQVANEELVRLTLHDPLTGILNRRGLEQQFHWAHANAVRQRTPLSVLIIDIDHFKQVNDKFGHDMGDITLQTVATSLRRRLRQSDLVARLGGEEFVAILPDTNAAQARVMAIKLVEFIAQLPFETVGSITISCGVAEVTIGDALATALKRADEALFRAKAAGRNRAAFAKTCL